MKTMKYHRISPPTPVTVMVNVDRRNDPEFFIIGHLMPVDQVGQPSPMGQSDDSQLP
jgi:hypothetical protein